MGGKGAKASTDKGGCGRGVGCGYWTGWVIGVVYPSSEIVRLLLLGCIVVLVGISKGGLHIIEGVLPVGSREDGLVVEIDGPKDEMVGVVVIVKVIHCASKLAGRCDSQESVFL